MQDKAVVTMESDEGLRVLCPLIGLVG